MKTVSEYAKDAGALLAAIRRRESAALLRAKPYTGNAHYVSPMMAKYIIARENGFTNWPALRQACAGAK